ncbi:sodium-coupled monocarboxylate transporter 1-like [Teleopsis dalmanni]|uniref:sodium-coupled monocarboxylate transporter 1-like n=1 Tax=Teleopsis dalmanni TaxID=139649 RepID=UPI0018CD3E0D|nr:sodium-coupled monocarboxylate transporter 1-like [Teleopsis dalmanni]
MPIAIYVPTLTFNQVTGIDLHSVTPIVSLICTIYTCMGGIKGVIWTDVLQSLIMISSIAFVVIKGTMNLGGLGVVYERNLASDRLVAPEMTFDPTVRMSVLSVFVGGTLFKLQGICISQPAVQRFLSLPNLKAVKKTLISCTIGLIGLIALCIYAGLLTYAAYYDCDPITTKLARAKDQVVPLFVMQNVGMYPGVTGLFVSGVFSAALSSLSTSLNSIAGVVLKDFVEPFRTQPLTERQTAILLRVVVMCFGLLSLAMVSVVEKLGMVMQLSATVGSMSAGPLLGIFTVGMLLPFVNTKSVLTGCLVAVSITGYIVVRAQVAFAAGEVIFPTKPVSVDGCTYEFDRNLLLNANLNGTTPKKLDSLHNVSFLWYTTIGSTLTILISLIATLFFGSQDTSQVDPILVVPFVRKFMKPSKYTSMTAGGICKKDKYMNMDLKEIKTKLAQSTD